MASLKVGQPMSEEKAAKAAGVADPSIKCCQLSALWAAWPELSARDLAKRLQGNVHEVLDRVPAEIDDDSAIRLSFAFKETGHPLHASSLYSGKEVKDRENNLYFTDAAEMRLFLERKLGKPRHVVDESKAVERPGILYFDHPKGMKTTGHLDLWDGKKQKTTMDLWHDCDGRVFLFELEA